MPASVQSYLGEPPIDGAPHRVWRDWALVGVVSTTAFLEAFLRTDEDWVGVSLGWRVAAVIVFFFSAVPSILIRRTQPLLATVFGFGVTMVFGVASSLFEGHFGGLYSNAVILVTLYAIYRWGSGRAGFYGFLLALAAGVIGNLSDPTTDLSDWIGGFIVLSIPIEVGLIVRYQRSARDRAISEAKSLERSELARELHDTVAHHVSAIAVQAQAGRALATEDPERALEVLGVIEEAASRTLLEMRSMVGTLRDGAEAELTPQRGLDDLRRLAHDMATELPINVEIHESVGAVAAPSQAALYRIARESITNAVRHARGATAVSVEVTGSNEMITLTVVDDGAQTTNRRAGTRVNGLGYGLLGMAERAELLGGSLHAGPRPSGGWQVLATIPRIGSGS